jgi:Type IV secretion system pilin
MKKKLMVLSGFVLGLAPIVALAQVQTGGASSGSCALGTGTGAGGGTLFGLLCQIGSLLNSVVPVLIALGVVYFAWGVISYVVGSDEEAKKKGRDRIIFGIIGLAVIIGLWGLVNLLRNTFGLNNTQSVTLPTIPVVIP